MHDACIHNACIHDECVHDACIHNVMHVSMMNVSMMHVYIMHACRYDVAGCRYDACIYVACSPAAAAAPPIENIIKFRGYPGRDGVVVVDSDRYSMRLNSSTMPFASDLYRHSCLLFLEGFLKHI